MLRTYSQTKELFYLRLRVAKDDAYFIYFTFEANEGLCYYSTADDSLKGQFRDIEVRCPIEWKQDLLNLIQNLKTQMRIDILDENIFIDEKKL
jgi:hypothetical protein